MPDNSKEDIRRILMALSEIQEELNFLKEENKKILKSLSRVLNRLPESGNEKWSG